LFLIYAAIRAIGGDGILAYQVVATLFAALTAWCVARIARHVAPPGAAILAGLVYIVYLSVNGGDGGQSPVFYNLPVALAASCVVATYRRPRFDRIAYGLSCLAMALCGLALQIKYSVLFEGMFFGLALVARALRSGISPPAAGAAALSWCLIALLPTAAVVAFYWHIGALDTLLFANFQSVFLRQPPDAALMIARLALIGLHLLPIAIVAACALPRIRRVRPIGPLLAGWTAAAIAGLLVFGTYFDHYGLPLVLPLSILAAPLLARRIGRVPVAVPVILIGLAYVAINTAVLRTTRGDGEGARRLAARIERSPAGCLFVFQGDPILYQLTRSCIPTAYNFPTFLSETGDSRTTGIDPHAELRRVMAARPAYVVISSVDPAVTDRAAYDFVQRDLDRHYRLVDRSVLSERIDRLYARVAD
jgi:hypothetical protein